MAAQLANYFVVVDEVFATLYQDGLSVTPRRVIKAAKDAGELLGEVASYLNQLAKGSFDTLLLMDRLLEASLCSINLNRIQNEVAERLHYPGIDGYITEKFSKKEVRSDRSSESPAS